MAKLTDIVRRVLNAPKNALERQVDEQLRERTQAVMAAAMTELDKVSPPIADLIAGEEITLTATVETTVRLRLKGN